MQVETPGGGRRTWGAPLAAACAAALLLGAGRGAPAAEKTKRREIVVLQELTQVFDSAVPFAELRPVLEGLAKALGPNDRLAVVGFDAKARVLQRLDDPVAGLPAKLAATSVCADAAACLDSDPASALQLAVDLFKGRPAGADRQILMVSTGAPCQFTTTGPAPAPGKTGVKSTRGVNPLEVVKVARAARRAGIRVSMVVQPKASGFVCLPRGSQMDTRGNLILRQYSAAVSDGAPALVVGEGRSLAELLAAALAAPATTASR
jgi:hypothetical protein